MSGTKSTCENRRDKSSRASRKFHTRGGIQELLDLTFSKQKADIRKRVLIRFLRVNLPAIGIAVVSALAFYYIPLVFFSKTVLSISSSSLSTLAIGILAATAAILTIMVAFLIFWFGNSKNRMESVRELIKTELRKLDLIRQEIAPFLAGPKEGIPEPLKGRLENLATKTSNFDKAISKLTGRFHRASLGTYYDGKDLARLDLSINGTGGQWFKAYADVFNKPSDRDFCRKTWTNAMYSAGRIIELNDELEQSHNQIGRIVDFMPSLFSILGVFVGSLVIAFIISGTRVHPISLLANLILIFVLIVLLSVHLVNIVRFIWKSVSSELATYQTNRLLDSRVTSNIEKKIDLADKEALKDVAKDIIDSFGSPQDADAE